MKILFKNALIVDPINKIEGRYDLLIEKGKIVSLMAEIKASNCQVIDLAGKILIPGLIDLHSHLREPGFEEKETILTGAEAAAAGGFTTIACMPNTKPPADNPATIEYIKNRANQGVVKVIPIGSITQKSRGEELAEIGFLAKAGITAISDDGQPVMNSEIMRRAMEYARSFNLTIIDHCEDLNLAGDGVINEGYYSTILGLKPIPSVAEEIMIARDILLAEMTGAKLHIAHVSTARGLDLITEGKKRGVSVTTEVTPHHLILTDRAVKGYNPDTKVNPPLRSQADVDYLVKGLQNNLIDVIATDHAPHTYEDKLGEYDYAANGISGLETALALIHHYFILTKIIDWSDLVRLMVINPSQILGIKADGFKIGSEAQLTIFDPDRRWVVDPAKFKSKGKNTPFAGEKLTGKVIMTIVAGDIVYDDRRGDNAIIYR